MKSLPVTLDLPAGLCKEIGRVLVGVAWIDWRLSQIIYDLLAINPKQGRLAAVEPRTQDRMDLVYDLATLSKVPISANKRLLRELLATCAGQRHQLAHGIWARERETNQLYLRLATGNWCPIPGQKSISRKIKPQAIPFDESDCLVLRRKVEEAVDRIASLAGEIERGILMSQQRKPQPPQ